MDGGSIPDPGIELTRKNDRSSTSHAGNQSARKHRLIVRNEHTTNIPFRLDTQDFSLAGNASIAYFQQWFAAGCHPTTNY
jgi:hypothetical protein